MLQLLRNAWLRFWPSWRNSSQYLEMEMMEAMEILPVLRVGRKRRKLPARREVVLSESICPVFLFFLCMRVWGYEDGVVSFYFYYWWILQWLTLGNIGRTLQRIGSQLRKLQRSIKLRSRMKMKIPKGKTHQAELSARQCYRCLSGAPCLIEREFGATLWIWSLEILW